MTHEHIQELYEIADGAYGDGPWMRGLAIERLRKEGHRYPTDDTTPCPPQACKPGEQ